MIVFVRWSSSSDNWFFADWVGVASDGSNTVLVDGKQYFAPHVNIKTISWCDVLRGFDMS